MLAQVIVITPVGWRMRSRTLAFCTSAYNPCPSSVPTHSDGLCVSVPDSRTQTNGSTENKTATEMTQPACFVWQENNVLPRVKIQMFSKRTLVRQTASILV